MYVILLSVSAGQLHELEHVELLREPGTTADTADDDLEVEDAVKQEVGRGGQEGGRRRLQDLQVRFSRIPRHV